jgi:hypothetical protein
MSGHEDEYGVFDLKGWCMASKITDGGIKKIEANAIDDVTTLCLFRDEDIDLLKLSAGDALRFRLAVSKLKLIMDTPPKLENTPDVKDIKDVKEKSPELITSERLYTAEEVQKLLAGKDAVALGATGVTVGETTAILSTGSSGLLPKDSLSSLLGKSSSTVDEVRNLMRELLNMDDTPLNAKGERVLLPIHFLSCVRGTQDKDEVIHSGKGLNLVIQTNTKRIGPEKITTAQWVSANARILDKLITSGRLTSSTLSDYLDYCRKIGDLLQLYTPSSVFMLDNNHRLEVHETIGKRWNDIDATLQNAHLKRKESDQVFNSRSNANVRSDSASVSRRGPMRHVNSPCWAFNSPEGCRFSKDKCKYDHVESSDRDRSLRERAPRFQKNASNAVANV